MRIRWDGFEEVCPICLGTGPFGANFDENTSFQIMDAYFEAGGDFLDTAHIYGAWIPGKWGASERCVGAWLRQYGVRDQLRVATKGGSPSLGDPATSRCGPEDFQQDINESLERLGLDYVDLYWAHRDDPARPVGEIIEVLAGFQEEGLTRAYGLSNWTVERLEAAIDYAQSNQLPLPVASQIGCSLAGYARESPPVAGMLYAGEAELHWHERSGFPMAAYSSQAHGWFGEENSSWAEADFPGSAPKAAEYDSSANRKRLLIAIELSERYGASSNQIALAYLMQQSFPTIPIIGTSKPDRIAGILAAARIRLADGELAALEQRE